MAVSVPSSESKTSQPIGAQDLLVSLAFVMALAGFVFCLLKMNPASIPWSQHYDPTGHWWLSTLLAALPVLMLLGSMAVLRLKAHMAALAGLVTALAIALLVYGMPTRLALTTAAFGAGYGLFPICWIILPVIFLYRLTVITGRFAGLQQSLMGITEDGRLQLLLIAFALGAFFEGTAGFGTPVAVCGAILISLGFRPLQAAGLSLIANTAPVAFGALGIPTITLAGVTGIDVLHLTRITALILAPFCVLVPFWIICAYAGFRRMLEIWPAILLAGATFACVQYLVAVRFGPSLVEISASISTILVLILFLRIWKPKIVVTPQQKPTQLPNRSAQQNAAGKESAVKAWLPWLIVSVFVFAWGLPQIARPLDRATTVNFPVAGLHNAVTRTPPVVAKAAPEPAVFRFNWAGATGSAIFAAALVAGLAMGMSPRRLAATFFDTLFQIRFTLITVSAMMALGFITRYCGLDATMGLAFARTGVLYPFFGTLIGWLGTATTGSDTSSNVLFGSLQKLTAQQVGVSPALMASANSTGGVMGKMIDAQSIVVASTATQEYGQEGTILRYVFWHSLALSILAGLVVLALAYVPLFQRLIDP